MIVFLIGFMGSGKSTLGKSIANALDWIFLDIDKQIEETEGQSIAKIFENEGEEGFRKIEQVALKAICSSGENLIVACGGGTPCFEDNMKLIKESGISFYLKMSVGRLFSRLSNGKTIRPLLKEKEGEELKGWISELLKKRSKDYLNSDFILEEDEIQKGIIVARILKCYSKKA